MDYPINNPEFLYTLWHEFRFGNADHATIKATIDPIIFASWERCQHAFTDNSLHLSSSEQRKQRQVRLAQHSNLISIAVPYMEDIHQFIEGVAIAVILTDHEGVVLSLEIDRSHVSQLRQIGMSIGEQWTEETIGTNAIGLSLITAMPTQVVGAEHFLQIFHDYGASAAPIHDEHGAIIGTIAIMTEAEDTGQAQLALVMATARAISNQLQSDLILQQANHRLRQMDSILEAVADGVITWDTDGIIENINSTACQMMGMRSSYLLGKRFLSVLGLPQYIEKAIEAHQELSDIETPVRINDRLLKCLISVRTVYGGANEIVGGVAMLRSASQVRTLVNQQASASPSITFENFYHESSVMRTLLRQARTAAKGSAGVLLIGEGGVGKTVLAQAIHNASPRAPKPFVVVNCGMIPAEFMVEELLGREGGNDQIGRPSKFELADGGTLLFDMIDQLSLQAQQILLNVVNSRHVNRLYAPRPTAVNVRIIATTTQDIETLVKTGSFSPQLYYLFNAFRLTIPPLRERRVDIITLALHFLEREARAEKRPYRLEPDVIELLKRYPWPGNVRELESVIERAVIHAQDNWIRVHDMPENVQNEHSFAPLASVPQSAISLAEAEYEAIVRAGWAYEGAISEMAAALGINRSTLWRKLKQHGLSANDFKAKPR